MSPNWGTIFALIFCFLFWLVTVTLFVNFMAPYMGSYR
jgi:hypothetical protein